MASDSSVWSQPRWPQCVAVRSQFFQALFLFVGLSLPSGPPCLIRVQLSLWCSVCSQPRFPWRVVPVPSCLFHPRLCRCAVVCLSLQAYFPVLCLPKRHLSQSTIWVRNPGSEDRTAARVGSYENKGLVSRSVGSEQLQRDSWLARTKKQQREEGKRWDDDWWGLSVCLDGGVGCRPAKVFQPCQWRDAEPR